MNSIYIISIATLWNCYLWKARTFMAYPKEGIAPYIFIFTIFFIATCSVCFLSSRLYFDELLQRKRNSHNVFTYLSRGVVDMIAMFMLQFMFFSGSMISALWLTVFFQGAWFLFLSMISTTFFFLVSALVFCLSGMFNIPDIEKKYV